MRRRPLCLLCLLFIFILCTVHFLGASFGSAPSGKQTVGALLDETRTALVAGRVRSCKTQGKTTDLILEDSHITKLKEEQLLSTKASSSAAELPLGGVRIALSGSPHYAIGDEILASGTLSAIEAPTNPGQFDQQFYYQLQGISWNLKKAVILSESPSSASFPAIIFNSIRESLSLLGQHLTDRIQQIFPADAAGILAAMITGDKSLLSEDTRDLYRLGGISHILAISGLHITLLGVGLYKLLRKLRLPLRFSGLCAAVFLLAYAILTGGSVATLRAVIMFLLYLLSKATFRVYDVPTALAVAAILILLENPLYLFYAGFQLSFIAVIALAAFPGHGKLFSGLILYLITAPFTLWHYFSLPLYGVFINLLVVPLLPFLLGFGLIALAGSFFLGGLPLQLLAAPPIFLLERIDHLLELAKELPFASLTLGHPALWQLILYGLLLAVFLHLLKQWRHTYRKYALLLTLPLLLGVFFLRPSDVVFGITAILTVLVLVFLGTNSPLRLWFVFFGKTGGSALRRGIFSVLPSIHSNISGKKTVYRHRRGIFGINITWRLLLGFSIAIPLLLAVFFLHPARTLTITFLDVGQGDGIVVSLPEGTILVDGGSSSVMNVGSNRLEPFLSYSGIQKLDYIAATHMDSDHISGIREILKDAQNRTSEIRVGTLLLPKLSKRSDVMEDLVGLAKAAGTRILYVSSGDFIEIGEAHIDILGPDPAFETAPLDENAQCIVLGLHYGSFSCLLTGDVQGEGEKSLLQKLRTSQSFDHLHASDSLGNSTDSEDSSNFGISSGFGNNSSFDVLKVAHHGSKNSTPEEFLSATRPKAAILSCGKNNSYGHPHEELLARLKQASTRIYRTDTQGAITVEATPDENGFTVQTFK